MKYLFQYSTLVFLAVFIGANLAVVNHGASQCDPSTIDLCEIGNNNVIQACYHAQIAKTSNGYSITGEDFAPNGSNYSTVLTNIPSPAYPMPLGIVPVWGAIGGRTQAVFIATDDKIYAIGEEDLMIDNSRTNGSSWGVTSLGLPDGVTVCDVNKWQGTAGSGSDNNNNSNTTGDRDGFLVFSTYGGEAYITGDGARAIQDQASNTDWTLINMPAGISVVNFGVGYRTLLILGSDGNLYAAGPETYLGEGPPMDIPAVTLLTRQPEISLFGISQIEAGFNSYFVLDGDGTVHVLGENSEGALGVGSTSDITTWSKVGAGCSGGVLGSVAYISTMSTHDNRISSSVILVNGTIRSWGSNSKQSITSGPEELITCPITPTGNNRNAVAISNGGHISPYVNTSVQICNIGHNRQGAFGDGNDEEGDYGEYKCRIIPGMPEICGTKEANLTLEKTVNEVNPSTGMDIVFSITVTNNGPDPSTGSFVRDQLNPAFYYLSDDSNGLYNNATGLWIVGPLEVGESKTLNITVKTLESGPQTNYAQILVDNEIDNNSTPGNNSSNEDDDDLVTLNIIDCGVDTSIVILCPGDSIFLNGNWIGDVGLFIETIPTVFNCDSLHITNVLLVDDPPQYELELDCNEMEYYLSVDPTTAWAAQWDNGDNNFQTIYNSSHEVAILTLEHNPNCIEEIAIDLPDFPDMDVMPNFPDTTILQNTTLEINTGLDPQEWQISWSPESAVDCSNCASVIIDSKESAEVTIYLEHTSGCTYEYSFFLTIQKVPQYIYAPNVFTPDVNTENNAWTVFTSSNVEIEECNVYDRWGNLMFQSHGEDSKWDGRYNGKDCEQGVYIYLIKYVDNNDEIKFQSGHVTLVR